MSSRILSSLRSVASRFTTPEDPLKPSKLTKEENKIYLELSKYIKRITPGKEIDANKILNYIKHILHWPSGPFRENKKTEVIVELLSFANMDDMEKVELAMNAVKLNKQLTQESILQQYDYVLSHLFKSKNQKKSVIERLRKEEVINNENMIKYLLTNIVKPASPYAFVNVNVNLERANNEINEDYSGPSKNSPVNSVYHTREEFYVSQNNMNRQEEKEERNRLYESQINMRRREGPRTYKRTMLRPPLVRPRGPPIDPTSSQAGGKYKSKKRKTRKNRKSRKIHYK